MLQTPIACPTGACRLGNARTRTNLRSRRPWHHREALQASLSLIPLLLWVASHALDELMRRLLVLHRLLEAEERLASPGASKR